MLEVLNILSVKQKIVYNAFVFIDKIKNQLLPTYICDKTKNFSNMHNYNTRNKNNFVLINKCNSEILASNILCRGLLDFNNLPRKVKMCETLVEFKKCFREYVLLKF